MRVAFLKSYLLAGLLVSLPMLLGGCPAKRGAPDAGPPDGKTKATPIEPLVVVEWSGKFADGWKEYDRLIGEQKLEAASKLVEDMLAGARERKNSEEWVRCLIRTVQVRTGLHGYETTLRFLREQPWPEDLLGSTTLNLYYAASLALYARRYSWEINQREKVETKGALDLKAWTMEQIHAEAQRAFQEVWKHREQLGDFPTKELEAYIQPNTFGQGIRPTLRDAVSYLRVELLADTTGWRPEHSNEIFRLDLGALLYDMSGAKAALDDPAVHPLIKIAFVLDDLERWHAEKGRSQAAFEARLERLRRLHSSFTQKARREKIKKDLRKRLELIRKKPWWAVGMAALAEFVRSEDAADRQIRARAIAAEGHKAYPDSVGGLRCLHIVKSIEAPGYQLDAMASDGPARRSIGVKHKNLDALWFRAYPLDLRKQIESSDDYDIYPSQRVVQSLVDGREPAIQWQVAIERPVDFEMHRKYVTPPMTRPGLWFVAASARKDFSNSDNVIQGVFVIVTDLVLTSRIEDGALHVTALSGRTGRPQASAEVVLYRHDWNKGHQRVAARKTGADGRVRFSKRSGGSFFLFARKGDQVALDPSYQYLYASRKPMEKRATLLFTDRSIYRPLQTLHFKAVVYRGRPDKASYKTWPNRSLTVSLLDPNHQTVATRKVTTNEFGTASGEFTIPAGRLLGQWRVMSSIDGQTYIRVEEYKRPTFEAKLLDPEKPLRLNRPAELKGEARYYFGLPVTSGTVLWKVVRSPVYPWWWGYYWGGPRAGAQSQTVATGTSELSEDGTFTIDFTPEADESLGRQEKHVTYRYQVTADVTDEGGETRSASRSFRLGFVAVEAAAVMESAFFREGQPAELTIVRTDLNGTPAPGKGSWRIVALETPARALLPADQPIMRLPGQQDENFLSPDDKLRPRWAPNYRPDGVMRGWADGPRHGVGKLTHDDEGKAELTLPVLPPGAYRLHYETTDAFGARFEMSKEFLVAGKRTALPLPALLLVERSSVKVGGTARVLALSGLDKQPVFLDIFHKGKLKERRHLEAGSGPNLIEIPVGETERGGFGLALTVLRDHQFMQFTSSVFVPRDDKELKLEFATFRDALRRGAKETWRVKLTAPDGKPMAAAAAEVLAYMYDRSLDAFTGHHPPSPLGLYPSWAYAGHRRASLGQARRIWMRHHGFAAVPGYPSLVPDRLRFFDEYGIGGVGRRRYRSLQKSIAMPRMDGAAPPAPSATPLAPGEALDEEEKPEKPADELRSADTRKGDASRSETADEDGRAEPQPQVELRSDFSETAFFQPHLLTDQDGSVTIEFEAPDSVTSWNVWVHAITKDLKSGSLTKEARSVKELMVRPYLPRFLREGDQAFLKVVVNNASERELKGHLTFDIIDPEDEKSVLDEFGLDREKASRVPFTVKAGSGTNLSFPVKAPSRVGMVAFRVTAVSGDISDGELRPIPLLPGRMHLAQSRFAVLKDKIRKELKFDDMAADDDPTRIHEQLVVTIDAQLFYSVLTALPYLINYPYECTEQLLNRFLSTGILASMYDDYPAVARMARKFSSRKTRLERFDAPDPNRRMALEETPWLQEARGGREQAHPLINVLDPRITKARRDSSLAKLKKAQTSSGAFPWFPGGPPSPYMTLYILYGFSKGLEFGIDVPKNTIQRAWRYMHRHYVNEVVRNMMSHDCCWEFMTFLNYVLSNYPDASWTGGVFSETERDTMLDFSFKHWKQHSPYSKGHLALTLARRDRKKNARLVWESVMDSAKQTEDQGTFWAPEDRAWLWYNDTIETHAFALRASMELTPEDSKLDGMVLWLFINKKLNHWKSTRATAEVIYSLALYLKKTGQLGIREQTTVTVGNTKKTFVFEPDEYTGKKNQVVIPGEKIDPEVHSKVVVEKETKGYQFASATWHFSTEKLPEEARGDYLSVTRKYFKRVKSGREVTLRPLAEGAKLKPGDEVEVQLSLRAKHEMEYVHLRDPRPAGFEPVSQVSRHRWNLGVYWYEEVRDSGQNFFFERLPVGEYPFKYRIRAAIAGTFKAAPALVQPMYAPEFVGYSSGRTVTIEPSKE